MPKPRRLSVAVVPMDEDTDGNLQAAAQDSANFASIGLDTEDVSSVIVGLYPSEVVQHFHHAVREGDLGFVAASLKAKPALVSSMDERLMCAVNYAIKYRRIDVLRHLLISGASPNQRGQEGVRPVHVAATCNATDALELLLRHKNLRLDAADDKGQTALHVACRRNHLDVVKMLLKVGADIHKQEKDGVSVMHQPCRHGGLELCQLLLSSGADATIADNNGVTPIMAACIEGRNVILGEIFRHLAVTQSKAQLVKFVNSQDNDGSAPLHHATQNRQLEIVKLLLDTGADINAKKNDGNTSLHIAASLGYQEMAALLLQREANPVAVDKRRRTPLHECGLANFPEISRQLIEKGADVNAADDQFMTPLHWASRRGHLPVAETLLGASARLDGHDVCMRTPLHWAVIEDRDSVLKRLLMEPGIERVMNKQDMHDKSPLHYAAESGCTELIQQLLSHGADCSLVDADERRPAHVAARLGHLDCLRLLVSATGAADRKSVGQRDIDESTSVLLAAEEGRFDVFRFLCDCGADFSAKDDLGRNALMLAVSKGHHDVAKFVLDRDIDINAFDVSKNTALHYAAKEPSAGDCVQLLLEYSARIVENCNKETPVDFAIRVNNKAALDVFLGNKYWSSTMAFRRENGRSHLDLLIELAPDYAMKVLDYSIGTTVRDPLDKNFTVIYNFSLIDPGPDDPASDPKRYFGLLTMAKHKRLDLLHHPLSTAVLRHKWQNIRYALWLDMLLYMLFLFCLSFFVVDIGPLLPAELDSNTGCRNLSSTVPRNVLSRERLVGEKSAIVSYVALRILVEIFKFINERQDYFKHVQMYFYQALYVSTFAFMWPPDAEPCFWNWICGIISVLLAWMIVLFHLEHIPFTGIYSLMFQKVLLSLLKVLHVFSFFIIGFALAFHITMTGSDSFQHFHSALLKTFDMTVGELDYLSVFLSTEYGLFHIAVHSTFVVFVIFMPIALINLLIGIAVGDIDGIKRGAELRLLEIRIKFIKQLERSMPRGIQRLLYKSHLDIHPNISCSRAHKILNGCNETDYRKYIAGGQEQQDQDPQVSESQKQLLMQQSDKISQLDQTLRQMQATLKQLAGGSGRSVK